MVISRGIKHAQCLCLFLRVIQSDKQYRHVCLEGYKVESLFPLLHRLARSFGSNAKVHPFPLIELFCQLIRQRFVAVSFNRYPPYVPEKNIEREEKPFRLDQEISLSSKGRIGQFAYHEIPVTCMRSHRHHAL